MHFTKKYFTLVELLVVLMILATLATLTTTSVESIQSKYRAKQTVSRGRKIIEALEQSDGLSFVSDFGRLPVKKDGSRWGWNEDELKLMFFNKFEKQSGLKFEAAPYRLFDLKTAAAKLSGLDLSVVNSNELKNAVMGGGWRGPYALFDSRDINDADVLTDGWGQAWDLSATIDDLTDANENFSIISFGRDGVNDSDAEAGGGWQDEDTVFSLRNNYVYNAELAVSVKLSDSITLDQIGVVYFSPYAQYSNSGLTIEPAAAFTAFTLSNSSWSSVVSTLSDFSISVSGNSGSFNLQNLYVGHRALLVYGRKPDGNYVFSRLQYLNIKPGTNFVSVKIGF